MGPFLRPYVIEQRLKNFCPMNSAEEILPSYDIDIKIFILINNER